MPFNDWLTYFEETLGYVMAAWNGPTFLTDNFNIDMLCPSSPQSKKYMDLLKLFGLKQIIDKPTRVMQTSASLIHQIIVSQSEIVKFKGILPCNNISDHDGPHDFLAPLLFNIYVNDLQDKLFSKSVQYVDDITVYVLCKPTKLHEAEKDLNLCIKSVETRANDYSLAINTIKSK